MNLCLWPVWIQQYSEDSHVYSLLALLLYDSLYLPCRTISYATVGFGYQPNLWISLYQVSFYIYLFRAPTAKHQAATKPKKKGPLKHATRLSRAGEKRSQARPNGRPGASHVPEHTPQTSICEPPSTFDAANAAPCQLTVVTHRVLETSDGTLEKYGSRRDDECDHRPAMRGTHVSLSFVENLFAGLHCPASRVSPLIILTVCTSPAWDYMYSSRCSSTCDGRQAGRHRRKKVGGALFVTE